MYAFSTAPKVPRSQLEFSTQALIWAKDCVTLLRAPPWHRHPTDGNALELERWIEMESTTVTMVNHNGNQNNQ